MENGSEDAFKILNAVYTDLIEHKIYFSNDFKIDLELEKIISLKPDAVFTNYIATFENTYDLLKKNGIEVIFLDEYLEQNPIEKSVVNFIAPLIFNHDNMTMGQAVLDATKYPDFGVAEEIATYLQK